MSERFSSLDATLVGLVIIIMIAGEKMIRDAENASSGDTRKRLTLFLLRKKTIYVHHCVLLMDKYFKYQIRGQYLSWRFTFLSLKYTLVGMSIGFIIAYVCFEPAWLWRSPHSFEFYLIEHIKNVTQYHEIPFPFEYLNLDGFVIEDEIIFWSQYTYRMQFALLLWPPIANFVADWITLQMFAKNLAKASEENQNFMFILKSGLTILVIGYLSFSVFIFLVFFIFQILNIEHMFTNFS